MGWLWNVGVMVDQICFNLVNLTFTSKRNYLLIIICWEVSYLGMEMYNIKSSV